MKRYLPFAIIALVLLIVLGGGALLFRSAQPAPPSKTANSTPAAVSGAEPPHTRGADAAPVTIEEFGDFQCPPCGALYPDLKRIESEYGPQRLRVIFREFPLVRIHAHALEAAHAAEAAGFQDHFWEMHDLLYENQKIWSAATDERPLFTDYARRLGLDVERFTRDMDGSVASMRVILDERRGESLGVKGTPTVFVDGRELPPAQTTYDGLRTAIETALNSNTR